MSDPLEPIKHIRDQLIKRTEPLGLKLVAFAVIPDDGVMVAHAQAVFEIDADMAGKDVAEVEEEREVQKFRVELAQAERNKKADSLKDNLGKLLEDGGGFLPSAE